MLPSSRPGEMPAGVLLDDEFELTGGGGGGRHRERPVLIGARDRDVAVLARFEFELAAGHGQSERDDVVGQRFQVTHGGDHLLQRDRVAQDLLVVVDQFDLGVAVHVGLAQQDVTLFALVVGQGERRVAIHLHVALDQEGLAGRALTFAAAVHQGDALPEGGVQDGLVFVDLHLQVDRFEFDAVGLPHGVQLLIQRIAGDKPKSTECRARRWRRPPGPARSGVTRRRKPLRRLTSGRRGHPPCSRRCALRDRRRTSG